MASFSDLFGQVFILDWGEMLGRFITYYRMCFFEDDPDNTYGWRLKGGDEAGRAKTEQRIYDRLRRWSSGTTRRNSLTYPNA